MARDRAGAARAQWEAEIPGLDLLPMEVLGRLAEATHLARSTFLLPVFTEFGLKPGEFDVLMTLRRSGAPYALTPTDLYNTTMITSGGMTARLDRLEKAGLIVRKPHETDRRAVQIALTPKGKELIDRMLPVHLAAQKKAVAGLDEAEQRSLADLLKKLIAGLPQK